MRIILTNGKIKEVNTIDFYNFCKNYKDWLEYNFEYHHYENFELYLRELGYKPEKCQNFNYIYKMVTDELYKM